jgi:hypothetical protein
MSFTTKIALKIFDLILSLCKNLITLNFGDMLFSRKRIVSFTTRQSGGNTCSTLIKLIINVENFFDFLYLLDGHFYCLSTLIVNVKDEYGPSNIDGIVSRILMFILREKKFQLLINIFFL